MINILVPIVENVDGFKKFIEDNKTKNVKFYVGLPKNLKEKFGDVEGVELHVYKEDSGREEILNALHAVEGKKRGRLVVVRRPLEQDEFFKLVSEQADVASFHKPRNKFVMFFKNLAKKILRSIFAITYFDDISAVGFSENMHELMTAVPNLSMATRINRYVGVDMQEIETNSKPARKIYDKFMNWAFLILAVVFLGVSIFDGVYIMLMFENIWALYIFLIIFWWIVAATILVLVIFKFVRTIAVGDLSYSKAEELEVVYDKTEQEEKTELTQTTPKAKKTATKKAEKKEVVSTKKTAEKKQTPAKKKTTTKPAEKPAKTTNKKGGK